MTVVQPTARDGEITGTVARCVAFAIVVGIAGCGRFGFETIDAAHDTEGGLDAGDAMTIDASDASDATVSDAGDAGDGGDVTAIHIVPNETLLSAGALHTCAGLFGRVYCWGDNAFGQLGDGTVLDRSAPVRLSTIGDAVDLQLGEEHSCALTRIGAVVCWGHNNEGQLGDGTTNDRTRPTTVTGLEQGAQSLWVGPFHACARAADGRIVCWGRNDHGQLGDGTTTMRAAPVAMNNTTNVDSLLLGADMTCALMNNRTVTCRGYNDVGQLGTGVVADSDQLIPTTVTGIADVRYARAGHHHVCAVLNSGETRCWGDNRRSQLGNDSTIANEPGPVGVSMLTTARFTAASEHTSCAVDETGIPKCWGASVAASTTDRRVPTALPGLVGVREIRVGRGHQCMRVVSNYIHCVGDNSDGQLGDGSRQDQGTTVQVLGLPAPVSGVSPRCGDEFITGSEACDDGRETARCNNDCTQSRCGDGVLNLTAGETCETASDLDAGGCLPDCTLP